MVWLEYIWLDINNNYRSKVRIVEDEPKNIEEVSEWNYDGSSTGQATVHQSEVILTPVKMYKFNKKIFVLCETLNKRECVYSNDYYPDNGTYFSANFIFDKYKNEEAMFGIEQEFFMYDQNETILEINLKKSGDYYSGNGITSPRRRPYLGEVIKTGEYYCGNGITSSRTRPFLEEVVETGLDIGLKISGMNYEVAPGQAEIQVCNIGIDACTDLLMIRFLLVRIGERHNIVIDFSPKPFNTENGSGCHINFSTKSLRNTIDKLDRCNMITSMSSKLELCHDLFINKYYGEGNKERLTGSCETSDFKTFSASESSRSVSIRYEKNYRYFEDRRPSSNINPYLACSKLLYHLMK